MTSYFWNILILRRRKKFKQRINYIEELDDLEFEMRISIKETIYIINIRRNKRRIRIFYHCSYH